jgi:hypothetical protein
MNHDTAAAVASDVMLSRTDAFDAVTVFIIRIQTEILHQTTNVRDTPMYGVLHSE